ncbi:hypothetical protein H0H87_010199 [Tephrocybe sp. NHM501043]|nr:hypothetical protein H0H87_010199 [Tephrocybe sp. NHM501043]
MGGLSIGSLIGPPVGGALFNRFGYRGPFIFSIIGTAFDLIARLLIIERKDALRWGIDPKELADIPSEEKTDSPTNEAGAQEELQGKDVEKAGTSTAQAPATESEGQRKQQQVSLPVVMVKLAKSSRASIAFLVTFIYGVVYTTQEPTLPLHLQQIWGLDSAKVGLVLLASVIPTLFSAPLTGWYTDKKGAEWVTFVSLALALPWGVVVIIEEALALFIVSYALEIFFVSGVISPITAELAHVAQSIDGVGYAHIYGVFNIAYGVGSASE